jgi:signal transduction histidine kinase
LYEAFLSQAAGENDKKYFSILDDLLEKTALRGGNVNAWQSVISAIRNKSISESGIYRLKSETMENIFNQSRVMISEKALRNIAYRQILDDKMYSHVNSVCRDLMINFDIDAIMDVAADEFPKLHISSCYVNIYENPDTPSEFSRLIMAYDKKGRIKLKQGGLIFATTEIVPDEIRPIDQKSNLFVMDLYFQKEQIGYIVFSDGAKDTRLYENFRTIISSSLKGALLVRQITDHAKELSHINKKLKFSNAELEQFAYVASHDLQEPLRKIVAFGNMLKNKYDNVLEDQGRDYIERMQNAASRMQQLIDDLLTYSRMTTNPEPFSSVDLSRIVNEVLSDLEVCIEKNKGRVEVGELPVIEAYPIKIRQLFQNLIGNALKFHRPEIPPVVKIYASQGMQQGYCRLIVEDNGIGIAEEDYEKLFKVFRRLHGRGEYEGSGIGLAVCKKIVEQHGGTIEVRSAIGAGTKIIFDLPVKI